MTKIICQHATICPDMTKVMAPQMPYYYGIRHHLDDRNSYKASRMLRLNVRASKDLTPKSTPVTFETPESTYLHLYHFARKSEFCLLLVLHIFFLKSIYIIISKLGALFGRNFFVTNP